MLNSAISENVIELEDVYKMKPNQDQNDDQSFVDTQADDQSFVDTQENSLARSLSSLVI